MQLVIFDLDGTLTRTTRVDEACYLRALHEEFGISVVDNDWSRYTHSTDSGITLEIFEKHFGRPPSVQEVARVKQRFVNLLAETFAEHPDSCVEVAGASAALQRVRVHPRWTFALATGSWRASALLKLKAAGLDMEGVPAAFADDSMARDEIVALALSRARERYHRDNFSRIVSVGDAPWDVRTARRLDLPFLGRAGRDRAALLRRHGASDVFEDFRDFDALVGKLEQVTVPIQPSG